MTITNEFPGSTAAVTGQMRTSTGVRASQDPSVVSRRSISDFSSTDQLTRTTPAVGQRPKPSDPPSRIDLHLWAQKAATRLESALRPITATETISSVQKWVGRVTIVDDDVFTADLEPQSPSGGAVVTADFDLTALDDSNISEGAIVYVTVVTLRGRGRLTRRSSSVRLQRLGNWSYDEVLDIGLAAHEDYKTLSQYVE